MCLTYQSDPHTSMQSLLLCILQNINWLRHILRWFTGQSHLSHNTFLNSLGLSSLCTGQGNSFYARLYVIDMLAKVDGSWFDGQAINLYKFAGQARCVITTMSKTTGNLDYGSRNIYIAMRVTKLEFCNSIELVWNKGLYKIAAFCKNNYRDLQSMQQLRLVDRKVGLALHPKV